MNDLLNWHENVFLLKCLFLHVYAYAILSTLFELTPYFSILYKYRLEVSGSPEGKTCESTLSRLGMS